MAVHRIFEKANMAAAMGQKLSRLHVGLPKMVKAGAILWFLRPASNLSLRISFAFFIDTLLYAIEVGLLPVVAVQKAPL